MGLLIDKYNEYLEKLRGVNLRDENDFSGMDSDFNTSGAGIKTSLRERESPLMKNPIFPTNIVPPGEGKINVAGKSIPIIPKSAMSKQNVEFAKNNQIPKQDAKPSDPIVMGGSGTQQADDINFMQKLANMANVDFDKAAATWKDKGGFEGLMSNPAFTIGLAFLQAGAEGKSLGAGALDNVIKAGAVSQQYKKIIESRKQAPIQATAADISETKNLLSKIGISEGNWFENFGSKVKNFFGKGGSRTPGLDFDRAVEEIAVQYQAEIAKKQAELRRDGKSTIIRKDDKLKILQKLIKSGVIQKNESFLSRLGITDATIQKREHGGPVHEGKSYLVGEKGPEVFIPKETGEVVANDDSQVFAMLLASNPQLQKVSKERAMKILKAKFPEYFD
jgi:hypothetical protein